MKGLMKILTVALLTVTFLCSVPLNAIAITDNGVWEDSKLCVILEADGESNSDLCFAAVKVNFDRGVNRIHLLFLLEYKKMNDDKLSGVIMNFNNMGDVIIMSDGTAEYDDDIYYAEMVDEISDRYSKNIMLETVVGIKDGIPDKVVMNVNIFDTYGIKSNMYTVDISDGSDEEPNAEFEDSTYKSVKEKETKHRTAKHKTTKVKTTKYKAPRSAKTKTKKNQTKSETSPQTEIDSEIDNNIDVSDSRKRTATAFGAAAAVVAITAGCVTGIKGKKKHRE